MDNSLEDLTKIVLKFRDDRNWKQFHTGKDLAICLNVEAGELLELFLWKTDPQVNEKQLANELGDVFYSLILLAENYHIDLAKALKEKVAENERKYPIDGFRNSNKKYNEK